MRYKSWATFCATHQKPPFITVASWLTWQCGRSRPTIRKIKSVAKYWHISERDILSACEREGFESASDLAASIKKARQARQYAARSLRLGRKSKRIGLDLGKKKATDRRNYLKPENIAKHRANRQRRRAAEFMAPGDWNMSEWWDLAKSYGYQCAYCRISRKELNAKGQELSADHIIGLNAWTRDRRLLPACTNHLENIAPCCFSCNSSKQNADLLEWAKRKSFTVHPLALAAYRRQHELIYAQG